MWFERVKTAPQREQELRGSVPLCVHLHNSPSQSLGARAESQSGIPTQAGAKERCDRPRAAWIQTTDRAGQGAEVGLLRAPPCVRFELSSGAKALGLAIAGMQAELLIE